ncbi:MAG: cyclic nucleotide-binding domain-containing protein [Desulfocapsa sp.]|nr:cyclic nucleotide-binding domain-containing protein [Desulfocapsa sp.]
MEINKDKQHEAQKKARELLAQQEQKRAESRQLNLVRALEQGKNEVLLNNEFMENLPNLISTYCQNSEQDKAQALIDRIGECACSEEDAKLRERAIMVLILCMVEFQGEKCTDIIEQIAVALLRWLRVEKVFLSVCDSVCKHLQKEGVRLLEEGLWKECYPLLEVFHEIQSGKLDKTNAIRSVVGRAQEALAADHIIEELTLVCLKGRGARKAAAEKILLLLGRKTTIHLLNTLISSQKKEDRLRLIEIIPATGYLALPVLKKYLQKELPWYAIRNIVLMIATMGDQGLLPLVIPFFEHNDVRVQQQVVDCILEIAKENSGTYLLDALPKVSDDLKPAMVAYLGKTCEPGSMDLFLDLLAEREQMSSHVRDELLQALAIQVRLSDSVRAVNLLNLLIEERAEHYDPESDPVVSVALQSLHILSYRFGSADIEEKRAELSVDEKHDTPTSDGDPGPLSRAEKKVQQIDKQVALFLDENEVNDASQFIYEKCVEAAMMKDFEVAEMLIDRILAVDPNAVAKLIRAGERIKEEKSSAVSSNHISIWQDLYDTLTTEEFNGLYYSLKQENYSTGDTVVKQGTNSPVLYFINSGQAKLTCQRGNEEIFLRQIGPGEIIGGSQFFDVSVWTASLTALGKVDLHVLERETFLTLLGKSPQLERCLADYCQKNESIPDILQSTGKDRRQSVRYPVSLIAKYALIDEDGAVTTRSFNGELLDISTGGLVFHIKIAKEENARLLLGRRLQTIFPLDEKQSVTCNGQIVAVRFQKEIESSYSVHIQFDEQLAETLIRRIANQQPVSALNHN